MKAQKRIVMFDVSCPKCKSDIPSPDSGSLNWAVNEENPTEVTCPTCGIVLQMPKHYSGE